jgi:hypothetical protein
MAAEKIVMDVQATMKDVKQKLLKTNTNTKKLLIGTTMIKCLKKEIR